MPLDGYLSPELVALGVMERGLCPPPPVDLVSWAIHNVRFGSESPFPGEYNPDRFPFYKRILECLSPENPARVVVLRGSAQIGKTVIAEIFLGGTEDLDPGPFLYVHPTEPNATRWVRTKWWAMVRNTPALRRIFNYKASGADGTSVMLQERKDGAGTLIVSGANSASSLSMISASRQVQDDLSKWSTLKDEGDPEGLADDRSKAFAWGKIFKVSTPHLKQDCRITRALDRGTQEYWHVPCPHCGHMQPLEWDDFRVRIEADPADTFFVCADPECGCVIEESHRADIVARGKWVAHNPNPEPDRVSFHLWAAYAGLESWDSIARNWLAARGDPDAEQRIVNTTGGEPYELPGEAPPWEELKKRADGTDAAPGRDRGTVPLGALLTTLTLDCQDTYLDGLVCGWGRDLTRYVVERVRVEGHISEPETRAALNKLVEKAWPTAAGTRRAVDIVGIDANAWTDDVFDWAKRWPKTKVVMVRGIGGDNQPTLAFVRKERRRDGKIVKYQGRFYNVGVSGLKGGLYKFLRVVEPGARGFVDFPAKLEDDYYEQLTAEKRTPKVDRKGFTVYEWVKLRSQRNEMLDVMVYGEALAGKLGWRTLTPAQWDALTAEREAAGAHPDSEPAQLALFAPRPAAEVPLPIGSASPSMSPSVTPANSRVWA